MPLILLLFGFAFAAFPADEFVNGIVRDGSGRVLPGARLQVLLPTGQPAAAGQSDAQGRFHLGPLPAGSYVVSAAAMALSTARELVNVPGEDVELRLGLGMVRSHLLVTAARGAWSIAEEAEQMAVATGAGQAANANPSIGHLLKANPNVLVQQSGTAQVSVFLRGLTGYQVLTLVDSVRFNNATTRSGPNQYLAFLDPSQAERLEAALGPNSVQYGGDSLGGTVQLLTREPRFASGASPEVHGDWSAFGGSTDLSAGSRAALTLAGKQWWWLAAGALRHHNDLRAGGGTDSRSALRRYLGLDAGLIRELTGNRQPDTAFSQTAAQSKFSLILPAGQFLTANYQYGNQRGSRNSKDLWGGLGRLRSDLTPQDLHLGYLRYEKLGLGPVDSLVGGASVNRQGDGTVRQGLRATDAITTDMGNVISIGYSAQATAHAGPHVTLVWGGETYGEGISSRRTDLSPLTGHLVPKRPLYPDDSRYRTSGLFTQARAELSRQWSMTAGSRWTHVRYATLADAALGVARSEQTFRDLTYQASLKWSPSPVFGFHALLGRGFRAPNANDLGAVGLNDLGYEIPSSDAAAAGALVASSAAENATSLDRAISSLRPERLMNYEAGWRLNTRNWEARAQVFDAEMYDPIVRRTLLFPAASVPRTLARIAVTPITPTAAQTAQGVVTVATDADPRAVKSFVNDGRSRYQGAEGSLGWRPSTNWRVQANYAFLAGRDLNPNRNIRRLPPQQGSLALGHTRGRYWWRTVLQFSGAQNRLNGGDIDDERIGASRSRTDIANFFQSARLARWVTNGVFQPTGETLAQVQSRILPGIADSIRVPLSTATAGWWTWNIHAGLSLGERWSLTGSVQNLLDRNYRVHGSGVDAPGLHAFLSVGASF